MTVATFNNKRSGCYLGESAALNIINEEIVISSGQGVLDPGTIIARTNTDAPTVTPGTPVSGSGGTVGNGAAGSWTADAGAAEGTWNIVITNENTNLGNYKVVKPDGTVDGYGTVGSAYNGGINGTLADGSNDWKEDDQIPMVVAYDASPGREYVVYDPTTHGPSVAPAILFHGVDATSADVKSVATVRGPATINGVMLTYKDSMTAANKAVLNQRLRDRGLAILPQHAA